MQCHDKQHSDYWVNSDGRITCPLHTLERMSIDVCALCYLQVQLDNVKAIIEDAPEVGSDLYDDAVTDVFNAADNAHNLLKHEHGEE